MNPLVIKTIISIDYPRIEIDRLTEDTIKVGTVASAPSILCISVHYLYFYNFCTVLIISFLLEITSETIHKDVQVTNVVWRISNLHRKGAVRLIHHYVRQAMML